MPPISDADKTHILQRTAHLWSDLIGARFFITGATGFYGKWILESIAAANDRLGSNIKATLLSRDPTHFNSEVPHLATRPEFEWLIGDMADFISPPHCYDYVFHFATTPAAKLGAGDGVALGPTALILENLAGTERVLRFAKQAGVKRLLYASSGAVYGRQPSELERLPEDYRGSPDPTNPGSAYGELKRMSELLCVTSGVDCVIARGFAFVGPYLPLTDKFAIGSFIRDALAGGPIRIHGDGTPVRSYLYAADLAVWLLTLLLHGKPGDAYNVGSDEAISLAEIARAAGTATSIANVEIAKPPSSDNPDRYVPSIDKAKQELHLGMDIPLTIALNRNIDWARQQLDKMTR